jgi:CheY-like chemotaxis protein
MSDAEQPTVPPPVPGPLILLADDNATSRAALTRMIRGLGFTVQSCARAADALRYLRTRPGVRLLVARLVMRGMDGGELIERARDLDPRLGVLLLIDPAVAWVNPLLRAYAELPRLTEPVGFGELYGALRQLLGNPPGQLCPPSVGAAPRRTRGRSSGPPEG